MIKKHVLWQKLADRIELPTVSVPGLTVAELWGCGRVLVENHKGVIGYDSEKILVKASYGVLRITGTGLSLSLMTAEQLIISGSIKSIEAEEGKPC